MKNRTVTISAVGLVPGVRYRRGPVAYDVTIAEWTEGRPDLWVQIECDGCHRVEGNYGAATLTHHATCRAVVSRRAHRQRRARLTLVLRRLRAVLAKMRQERPGFSSEWRWRHDPPLWPSLPPWPDPRVARPFVFMGGGSLGPWPGSKEVPGADL